MQKKIKDTQLCKYLSLFRMDLNFAFCNLNFHILSPYESDNRALNFSNPLLLKISICNYFLHFCFSILNFYFVWVVFKFVVIIRKRVGKDGPKI